MMRELLAILCRAKLNVAGRRSLAAAGLLWLGAAPLCAAQSADGFAALLAKTHAQAEQFAQQFSMLRYDDDVIAAKLKSNDKVAYQQETVYDSLLRVNLDGGQLHVDEQRLVAKPPRRLEKRPLLETFGFSVVEMIFHPYYEASFQFSDEGSDMQDGHAAEKIGFQHLPNTPSPILYQTIGPDRPLDIAGTAWVDAASGAIYRIDVTVSEGISDAGIRSIKTSVVFEPVVLQGQDTPEVLPARATIDLETPRQHWRNTHEFSDYRKYRVAVNMPGGTE
jgi:hypothetical protein